MKLNKKSWHCKLYKWAYSRADRHLPKNLCNYFWSVMFAVITLPITVVSVFIDNISDYFERLGVSLILYLCLIGCWFIGFTILRIGFDPTFTAKHSLFENYSHNWFVYAALPAGVAIVGLGIYAVRLLCDLSDNLSFREKVKVEKQPNIMVEYLKAKKEKACPFIDWE